MTMKPLAEALLSIECQRLTVPKPVAFSVIQDGKISAILTRPQVVAALADFDRLQQAHDDHMNEAAIAAFSK